MERHGRQVAAGAIRCMLATSRRSAFAASISALAASISALAEPGRIHPAITCSTLRRRRGDRPASQGYALTLVTGAEATRSLVLLASMIKMVERPLRSARF